MIDIEAIIPGGILCSWSAWSIHQLTTTMPQAYHIAIKRDRKVVTPSFPSIELHHYTASILEIGVSKMFLEGYNIRIYDIERCVCDAIKFRNKIGMDVCSEIIDNYLVRLERNISKLLDYAKQLRVGTILEDYLQVKLWARNKIKITENQSVQRFILLRSCSIHSANASPILEKHTTWII